MAKASDGFYYYATFNSDGTQELSSDKASDNPVSMSFIEVRPPQAAIQRSKDLRRQFGSIIKRSLSSSPISIGNKHFLVMLVEYSDVHFSIENPYQAFYDLCNKDGYSVNGGTGSVSEYYKDNSMGEFVPQFDIVGPVRVPNSQSHYASMGHGKDAAYLLADACKIADENGLINFADYDLDGDGSIDNIFLFYAGYSKAEGGGDNCIWPHRWTANGLNVMLDGVKLADYACASELHGSSGTVMTGIGTMCHEFGHVLGLMDYYDTDDEESGGKSKSLWDLSLMALGVYNNGGKTPPYLDVYSRYFLGWNPDIEYIDSPGEKTLENISDNVAYILKTDNEGEYFLLESRSGKSGTGWDVHTLGFGDYGGLAVYHIDQSNNFVNDANCTANHLWNTNSINVSPSHQCFDLVENVYPESDASSSNLIFPGNSNNKTTLSGETNPSFKTWDGESLYTLTDISSIDGYNVRFNIEFEDKSVKGVIKNTAGNPIEGVNVSISEISLSDAGELSIKSVPAGAEVYNAVTDANGNFNIEIGKNPATEYRLKASCPGCLDYFEEFTVSFGTKTLNVVMRTPIEDTYRDLQKFSDFERGGIGFGVSCTEQLAKVQFYDYELIEYVGNKLKYINLMLNGNSAQSLSVFVEIGKDRVCEQLVAEPVFGSIFSVDISDANVVIPANERLTIGYDIIGCDNGWPIVVDYDPEQKKGGGFISKNGKSWQDLSNFHTNLGNIVLSATVMPDNGKLSTMGFNYIISPKDSYAVGEIFKFKLSPSVRVVRNVKWFFDGEEISDPSIALPSGMHEVRAEVEYDGLKFETLVIEINVDKCII